VVEAAAARDQRVVFVDNIPRAVPPAGPGDLDRLVAELTANARARFAAEGDERVADDADDAGDPR
jgi:hypothetical protein